MTLQARNEKKFFAIKIANQRTVRIEQEETEETET